MVQRGILKKSLTTGTVEVQEQAVVSVSYQRWNSVHLLHHQHCFHSSPKNKRFSHNTETLVKDPTNRCVSCYYKAFSLCTHDAQDVKFLCSLCNSDHMVIILKILINEVADRQTQYIDKVDIDMERLVFKCLKAYF